MLERRNGDKWWPSYAKPDGGKYLKHARDMETALRYCKRRDVVVQAGGHVGMWPLWLSSRFTTVYTFEPEPRNFEALKRNVPGNVHATNAALSDTEGQVLLRVSKNAGGHSIANADGLDVSGDTLTQTIDKLHLRVCDLIVLDVEGYELPALRGAIHTLATCSPVLQLEDRGHGIKKGRGDTFKDLESFLYQRGYKEVDRVRNDVIFIKDQHS